MSLRSKKERRVRKLLKRLDEESGGEHKLAIHCLQTHDRPIYIIQLAYAGSMRALQEGRVLAWRVGHAVAMFTQVRKARGKERKRLLAETYRIATRGPARTGG